MTLLISFFFIASTLVWSVVGSADRLDLHTRSSRVNVSQRLWPAFVTCVSRGNGFAESACSFKAHPAAHISSYTHSHLGAAALLTEDYAITVEREQSCLSIFMVFISNKTFFSSVCSTISFYCHVRSMKNTCMMYFLLKWIKYPSHLYKIQVVI